MSWKEIFRKNKRVNIIFKVLARVIPILMFATLMIPLFYFLIRDLFDLSFLKVYNKYYYTLLIITIIGVIVVFTWSYFLKKNKMFDNQQ